MTSSTWPSKSHLVSKLWYTRISFVITMHCSCRGPINDSSQSVSRQVTSCRVTSFHVSSRHFIFMSCQVMLCHVKLFWCRFWLFSERVVKTPTGEGLYWKPDQREFGSRQVTERYQELALCMLLRWQTLSKDFIIQFFFPEFRWLLSTLI